MDGKIWARIFAGLVLIAAVAGIGFLAFGAGVATHIQLPAATSGQVPYPYYGWHVFPFWGLGCLGPLVALFLLFLALRAISFLFWGPRWGWHRWGHRAWRHGMTWDDGEGGVPPMFREMHDRAHGKGSEEKQG